MDVFTEVYITSVDLLKAKCFDDRWSNIEPKLKALLATDGPEESQAMVLDLIRSTLAKAANGNGKERVTAADEILKVSRSSSIGFQDRAALLKAMKHFYFVIRKGNQRIWVVDLPQRYGQWTYDLFSGKSIDELKALLQQEIEVFGEGRRKLMSDALQLARKWSLDVTAKLSTPAPETLEAVKRWFHAGDVKPEIVKASAAKLLDGFKKIANTCNSTRVIFSDRPHKRVSGTYDQTFASVNSGDSMPVIYIFKLFLEAGKKNSKGQIGKLWLSALTIIHELSHKLAGTRDVRYDDQGLKPNATSLSDDQSIVNADSWAYFAADLVGALPPSSFKAVYQ
jgi:hypothetical protein